MAQSHDDTTPLAPWLIGQARWITLLVVAISLIPALLWWLGLGIETGLADHTDHLEDWLLGKHDELGPDFLRTKLVYTIFAGSTAGIALLTSILGYVHFHIRREIISLLVAIATFWSGAIIALQLLAFHGVGASLYGGHPGIFVQSNWTLSQSFTGLLMVALPAGVLSFGNRHKWLTTRHLAFIFVGCAILAYSVIHWSSVSPIFPEAVTGQVLGIRLIELGPFLLFTLAFIIFLPRVHHQCRSTFSLSLWLASIPLICAHLYMALLSETAFDAGFTSAQLMRSGAFLIIFGGLAVDYAKVCQREDELNQRLSTNDRRLRILLDNAVEAIAIFDDQRQIKMWNCRAVKLLGRPRRRVLGQDIATVLFGDADHDLKDQRQRFLNQLKDLQDTDDEGPLRSLREGLLLRPDGATVEVEYSIVAASEGSSRIYAVLIRDVSERKELQRRMARMDRLVAVGTLAAGVVHEIKNPLTYVLSNVHLARESADHIRELSEPYLDEETFDLDPATIRDWRESLDDLDALLHTSNQGIERLRRITLDMQAFAHRRPGEMGPTSVAQALDIALRMTRAKIRHQCRLDVHIEDIPPVEADETRLSQVFINLITNALQAMTELPDQDHLLQITANQNADGMVRIRFRDTGPGISEPVQNQIFEPFYTTKAPTKGTGLGLSISRSILHSFDAEIRVDSTPGEGATFTIEIPPIRRSNRNSSGHRVH